MENHAVFAAGVEAAAVKLMAAGKKIWLVGPIPEVGFTLIDRQTDMTVAGT
jgi:hypothetical protein